RVLRVVDDRRRGDRHVMAATRIVDGAAVAGRYPNGRYGEDLVVNALSGHKLPESGEAIIERGLRFACQRYVRRGDEEFGATGLPAFARQRQKSGAIEGDRSGVVELV